MAIFFFLLLFKKIKLIVNQQEKNSNYLNKQKKGQGSISGHTRVSDHCIRMKET